MNKVRVFKMLMLLFVLTSIIGTICRIQHWPFGKELCIAGCIGLGIFSVLYFSSKSDKSILDKLALIGFPLLSISLFFRSNRLPFQFEVFLVSAIIILGYSSYLLVQSFRNDKSKSSIKLNWQRFVLIAIFLFVGFKVLSKTYFWPFAAEFLLIEITLSLIYFFWGMFAKDETEESDE